MVQDDVVAGIQLVAELLSDRLTPWPFMLEAGVLGVVHAVSAVEAAYFLVHGLPRAAVVGQGLGDGGLPRAGDAVQENGKGPVVCLQFAVSPPGLL
ncbi:hypothetical protein NRF20_43090 [Streptomyces sp. R-74717]